MSRAHAARQLLRHGALSLADFVTITGWRYRQCRKTLDYLVVDTQEVQRANGLYQLNLQ